MAENRGVSRGIAAAGYAAAGVVVMAAGVWVVSQGLGNRENLLSGIALFVGGLVVLLVGFLLFWNGVRLTIVREEEWQEGRDLEKRAERQGLPTEPEAYQDGGLAVAATAETLPDAELLASRLKGEGIPAWVDGSLIASWGIWAYQSRGGVRVVVPQGRLEDAQAVLAERRRDEPPVAEESAEEETGEEEISEEETSEEETSEEESRMVRQAMALSAAAILLAPVGLYILFRAFRLSAAIAGARRQWWASPALRRAHRWTLAAMLLATVSFIACWGLLFSEIIRHWAR
ncbi:MAG TPA: hypothetical protein VFH53_03760 [Phycisphaerae bacterium]|nr:hypothetical protein [Phycisphaerae bacterium]